MSAPDLVTAEPCCPPSDVCSFCGCCQHTPDQQPCKVTDAPSGMRCQQDDCGCEGRA